MALAVVNSPVGCSWGVKVKDELQEYREIINEVFDQYISNTNRFKTK